MLLLVAVLTPSAAADDSYEVERTKMLLRERALVVEPLPEGKRIRKIDIVNHDVFSEDEFWPTWWNIFHWRTRRDVVARELLFAEGEPWTQARIDETARKLRDQVIFTFVRIEAVRPELGDPNAPGPDEVDVIVYTRDLWSLRLEMGLTVTDGLVNELTLVLIERNLWGRNIQAALTFEMLPKTVAIGQTFVDRRLFNSRLTLSESFELVLSRDSGEIEGTRGGVEVGIPYWDLRPRWGFLVGAAWNDTVGRQLSGSDVLTWDPTGTAQDEAIPRIWDQTAVKLQVTARRQLGDDDLIHRIDFGQVYYSTAYRPHRDTGLTPDTPLYEQFEEEVTPPSREQSYPYIRWQMFTPKWAVFNDLAAFGLSEDVRTGPSLELQFAAPLHAFGSDRDAIAWDAAAGLVLAPPLWGDRLLVDLNLSLSGRMQGGEVIDQLYRARLRTATPRFALGRVVASFDLESRVGDSARTLVTLGGDNGLRGYGSQQFYGFGADRLRANLELRSPPLVLGSVHIGGILFYDVGGVGDGPATLDLHHATGLGLRMLLPQFNRFALRFDLGFPLDSDRFTVLVTIGSTQAVPLTTVEDEKLSQ